MIYNFSSDQYDTQASDQRSTDFRSDIEQNEPLLGLHNYDSMDLATACRMARELIHTNGAKIPVYIRTNNADFIEVHDEDPDPTYWPPETIRGFFKPQPMEFELKRWGVDAVNKTEVVFCASDLRELYGERMLRSGDVLKLPYNSPAGDPGNGGTLNPTFYKVVNASPSGMFRYHWLYFTCTCSSLNADVTVRPVNDMPMSDPYNDSGKGVYGSA